MSEKLSEKRQDDATAKAAGRPPETVHKTVGEIPETNQEKPPKKPKNSHFFHAENQKNAPKNKKINKKRGRIRC